MYWKICLLSLMLGSGCRGDREAFAQEQRGDYLIEVSSTGSIAVAGVIGTVLTDGAVVSSVNVMEGGPGLLGQRNIQVRCDNARCSDIQKIMTALNEAGNYSEVSYHKIR